MPLREWARRAVLASELVVACGGAGAAVLLIPTAHTALAAIKYIAAGAAMGAAAYVVLDVLPHKDGGWW